MEEQLSVIKDKFSFFLARKSLKDTTVKQYIVWMARIEKWFIENKIVDKNFNIWQDKAQIEKIQFHLEDEANSGWKTANKPIKNWMSAPWNAWVDFNNNVDVEKDEEFESKKSDADLLEKFADWVIERDGKNHNYFSDSFGSKKSNLVNQLSKYDDIYRKQFGNSVFNLAYQDTSEFISKLEENLYLNNGNFYEYSLKISSHMPRAILGRNNYIKFLKEVIAKQTITEKDFDYKSFHRSTIESGLLFSEKMVARFVASLCTKPFVICSGLSGSGKTKLAQSFVQWICQSEAQYKIIPVGADWTNREPLLGYPNAIEKDKYVVPENGALALIINAINNAEQPYFLMLDEMNLSHVERYFADFLSAMESDEAISLHTIKEDQFENEDLVIPQEIKLPKNLFIIGTVNIDETTYMFSPKVLDRANTIEFKVSEQNLEDYFALDKPLNMKILEKEGISMSQDFVKIATEKNLKNFENIKTDLLLFFNKLEKNGAEFGYRTASEIDRLIQKLASLDVKGDELLDIAIMQKLLPKLHGSRSKLSKALITLGALCLKDAKDSDNIYFKKIDGINFETDENIKYKLSFEKIIRMYKNALENGYASYAEN